MIGKLLGFLFVLFAVSSTKAEVHKWSVSTENVTCLIVQMDLRVNFTYQVLDNTTKTVSYEIPSNFTTVDGAGSNCNAHENILKVSWMEGNTFEIKFQHSSNESAYDLTSIIVSLNTSSIFNDSQANQTVQVSFFDESFKTPSNFSYHCNRQQQLNATNGEIIVSKVQFEAFRFVKNDKFSSAKDCDSSITPDIVPIAVGISLIALIVVVLIAYLVGRRRQARGYLNI